MPYSLLHIAALRNDIENATKLLDGGGEDLIHVWESQDKKATIDAIEVDIRDDQGWTPLMCAATHGHIEMCDLLLDFGADVNARKNFSVSSLHLACRNGHAETVLFLIENNADILMDKVDNSLPIHDAAFGGHVECAKILLRAGQASQLPSETHLSKRMEGGSSPLHIASKRGHPDLVKVFLEAGASIIARDESNKQPHEVAKNRRTLISFPRAQDPAEIQSSEVGAMSKDIMEYVKPIVPPQQAQVSSLTSKTLSVNARRGGTSKQLPAPSPSPTHSPSHGTPKTSNPSSPMAQSSPQGAAVGMGGGRPKTSDVGNFTSSLGILHEMRK